jgi:hypothetical protein
MIDNNSNNSEIINLLRKLGPTDLNEEILLLFIMKNRYSLTEQLLKSASKTFNPIYAKVALEND